MDRKQIIVSTVAGLGVIVVGYIVWMHEQSVQTDNAQAQQDANQAQLDQFSQEIAALPAGGSYGGGYYTPQAQSSGDVGSNGLQTPASSSTDLQAILQAFFPQPTAPATGAPSNTVQPTTTVQGNPNYIDSGLNTFTAKQTATTTLPTTNYYTSAGTPSIYSPAQKTGNWLGNAATSIGRGSFGSNPPTTTGA